MHPRLLKALRWQTYSSLLSLCVAKGAIAHCSLNFLTFRGTHPPAFARIPQHDTNKYGLGVCQGQWEAPSYCSIAKVSFAHACF